VECISESTGGSEWSIRLADTVNGTTPKFAAPRGHLALPLVAAFCLLLAPNLTPAQAPGGKPLRRIAFGSCARQEQPQPIWEQILAAKPDIFLSLGDIVYVNRGGEDAAARRAAYATLQGIPAFYRLRRTVPFFATWDDGEFGENNGGADFARKEEFRQDFLDFLGEPKDSLRRRSGGVYHSRLFGPPGRRVQIVLLDTRSFRSPLKPGSSPELTTSYLPDPDPGKTMLGAVQWSWLEEQLRVPAEIRLIVSSIQVIPEDHPFEKWANLPLERQRLFDLIRKTGARGVVFLSGDRHLAELSMMDGAVGYPLYDLTSSGLNVARKEWRFYELNRHRIATMNWGDNFGMVVIDWNRPDPRISLQIRDVEGDISIQQKILLSGLQPDVIR
jgi:alkaline phosphatase D